MKIKLLFLLFLAAFLSGCISSVTGHQPPKPKPPKVAAKSYFDLGVAYIGKKRYDLAEPKLIKSLSIYPLPETLNALAVLYEEEHDNALAEETYEKLVDEFPKYIRGYLNYHIFLCKYDRQDKIKVINKTMESKDKEFAELGKIAAGNCALSKGRTDIAEKYYKEALAYNPYSKAALLPLAKIYYDRGFVSEAKVMVDLVNNQVGYSPESVYLSILINRELGNRSAEHRFMQIMKSRFANYKEASILFR